MTSPSPNEAISHVLLREAGNSPNGGHRVACHFYEMILAPTIIADDGPAAGKFAECLAAFEPAKQARVPS